MTRLVEAWRAMDSERRFAVLASLALFISMFLPWYQQNGVVRAGSLESRNLDAFQVFSFVEAAVLLVALALLYMLYARAEGRDFRVPGSDGTIVLIAGIWVGALLIFRLFDKPGISSHGVAANVGVQWGIFFALAAAGLIAWSGSRMRGSHLGPRLRPSGHRRRNEEDWPESGEPGRPRARRDTPAPDVRVPEARAPEARAPEARAPSGAPGQAPSRAPAWEDPAEPLAPPTGEPPTAPTVAAPEALSEEPGTGPTQVVPAGRPGAATPAGARAGARSRPRYPPAPGEAAPGGEQLSFEDAAGDDEGA